MSKCLDCIFLESSPFCSFGHSLGEAPLEVVDIETDCANFHPAPPLLVDELVECLNDIMDALRGSWYSHTKLPGKWTEAETEARKLTDRAEAALARHKEEVGDA